ncbi:aldo/keto reductase [Pontiella agarivorans]|uniref:Aldo/keto reductase n=1 Tax=Pontiella agarivorans TaxID=3038953 RepID=A0ABU5MY41_9BACT|nr:aldo/keto reductase [Pontiella agarivorans]MDZ8119083.1 aldo/keto reductase [Pontiella agarivorans]
MPELNRNEALKALAGVVVAGSAIAKAEGKQVTTAGSLPLVELGNTGIRTSRLAQGTGTGGVRRQSKHTKDGFENFVNLMIHAYDRGIRFYDLADQYGSHFYFREALRTIPREQVTLLSKIQVNFDSDNPAKLTPAEQRRFAANAIDRFRLELQVDVIDVLLLHNVQSANWDAELAGYMDVMSEYKQRGVIRATGMSCHTLVALKRAAELDWVDVALTRINPYGKAMDGPVNEVMPVQQKLKDRGASVIGMKIFGAGRLVDKRDECMEFAQNLDYLDAMTIGSLTPEQIDDNIRLMEKYPVAM